MYGLTDSINWISGITKDSFSTTKNPEYAKHYENYSEALENCHSAHLENVGFLPIRIPHSKKTHHKNT